MPATIDAAATSFLSRFVEDIRALAPVAGHASRFDWLPDGRTALVFRVLTGGHGDVAVLGPRTRALLKNPTGVVRVVVLQFKPGWSAALLGVAASALTDRIVPLADLWGRAGGDLTGELLEARSLPDVLGRISMTLAGRVRETESSSAPLARRAARLLEGDAVRVTGVAAQLGVSDRHLRRAFTETIGIGPKDFARGVRLRRAVRMTATSQNWVRIAAEAGYYDQAHLIADFRKLTGLTPRAFLQTRSRFHQI